MKNGFKCYEFVTGTKKTWGDAQTACRAKGANLVVVDDQDEMDFILGEILRLIPGASFERFWSAGTKVGSEWKWDVYGQCKNFDSVRMHALILIIVFDFVYVILLNLVHVNH